MIEREKITTLYFSKNNNINIDLTNDDGIFYLEKHSKNKLLCYKKGNVVKSINLTKKTFQLMKHACLGPHWERYIETESKEINNTPCLPQTRVEVYDFKYCKSVKEKGKSEFIIQEFKYVRSG